MCLWPSRVHADLAPLGGEFLSAIGRDAFEFNRAIFEYTGVHQIEILGGHMLFEGDGGAFDLAVFERSLLIVG